MTAALDNIIYRINMIGVFDNKFTEMPVGLVTEIFGPGLMAVGGEYRRGFRYRRARGWFLRARQGGFYVLRRRVGGSLLRAANTSTDTLLHGAIVSKYFHPCLDNVSDN